MQEHDTNATPIAALNDRFRHTFWGGQVLVTDEVSALSELSRIELFRSVQLYDNFVQDNDPYGEHDFGKVVVGGQDFFWKIDYYDNTLRYGSENPADPKITTRVLTIMKASEY